MNDSQPGVLVVEDDARTSAFLAENLKADGFAVAVASEAGEAVRAIEVRRPDLVVLDLTLDRDSSGLSVLDRVRSADGVGAQIDPGLPVIILSGRATELDRVRGLTRGADDFIVKPTASLFAAETSGSRWRIGRHVSSTPARTSGRAHGVMVQRSASTIAPPQ